MPTEDATASFSNLPVSMASSDRSGFCRKRISYFESGLDSEPSLDISEVLSLPCEVLARYARKPYSECDERDNDQIGDDQETGEFKVMLLQKTLHVNQPLAECKTRLASIQWCQRHFALVTKSTITSSKTVDFCFRGPLGFKARTMLSVESDSPDQMAFESTGGNLDVVGLVELAEIRPNWTEVTLALHCQIKNRLFAWLDRRSYFMEAFVASELRSIRAYFEEIAALRVQRERAPMISTVATGS